MFCMFCILMYLLMALGKKYPEFSLLRYAIALRSTLVSEALETFLLADVDITLNKNMLSVMLNK